MNKISTSLEQSKKLMELGIDVNTADMFYADILVDGNHKYNLHPLESYGFKTFGETKLKKSKHLDFIPVWSLAALLDILPDDTNIIKDKSDTENEKYMCTVGVKGDIIPTFGNNPVDACYEMILKLHELNLL